jgi:hypothetical protein
MNELETTLATLRKIVAAHGMSKLLAAVELVAIEKYDEHNGDNSFAGLTKSVRIGGVADHIEKAREFAKLAGI